MSTGRSNISAKRIAMLAARKEQVFHSSDLANLWLIVDKNNLYTTLKRYQKAGLLFRIYKGFYSLVPEEALNPLIIGAKALHQYCYVSTETVLFQNGYISQGKNCYTFISSKSLKFAIGSNCFKSRRLTDKFLFNPVGITKNEINVATPERAIADMLYFDPYFHFDKSVNWEKVKRLQKIIGYPLTRKRYATSKIILRNS